MKRIFSLFIAVLMVAGMLVLVPSAEDDELPADAIALDYAGYIHDAYFVILAGDNMTVAELTALGIGESKDMNYFAVAVVDGFDRIVEINMTLGRPDGVKSDMVCPEYGYIIGLNGNKAGYDVLASAQVGDEIELFNVDLDTVRGAEGNVKLENAGFVIHSNSDSDVWLNMPITAENGVAVDEGDVDGQLYVYPAGEEDRVLESSEGNLRYSYVVVCDADGKPLEAGNNLVFASVDDSFQNEVIIPAGGFAFSFYYNSDNPGNQELYEIYDELISMALIYNETIPVTTDKYTFAYADGWLEVYKAEEEAPESSEEESSEAPAESSEEPEESSEAPAESSEEEQTSVPAPSTSAPAASSEAPADDGGAPIGIIIGVIAGVVVIAVVVVVIIRKKK